MSLIQEALKRKQQEDAGVPPPVPPPLPRSMQRKKGGGGAGLVGKLLLALMLLAVMIGVAFGLFYLAAKRAPKTADVQPAPVPAGEQAVAVAVESDDGEEAAVPVPDEPVAAKPVSGGASGGAFSSVQEKVAKMKDAVLARQQEAAAAQGAKTEAPVAVEEEAPAGDEGNSSLWNRDDAEEKPAKKKKKSSGPWPMITVNGVLANSTSQNKAAAIVNNRVVSLGETVEGAKIVDIQHSGVEFEYDGERRFVGMGQSTDQ